MGLVTVESLPPRLVPVDDPGPSLVPVDDPGPRLVPVDGPAQGQDQLLEDSMGDLPIARDFAQERAASQDSAPLPAGVHEYSGAPGVYYRVVNGQAVPVGEKPVEESMFNPVADPIADAASGGLYSLANLAGRSIVRTLATKGGRDALKILGSGVAKVAAKDAARDAAWGSAAGALMEAGNQATGSELAGAAAGMGIPLAARGGLVAARKGLATGLDALASRAVQKAQDTQWARPLEGGASHGWLMRNLGTRSEAVGPDVFGKMMVKDAKLDRDLTKIQAETGRYVLRPGLAEWASSRRWMSPETGLILGQKAREAAGKVHPKLAQALGMTDQELITARVLAESMSGVDPNGVLQFGVRVKVKGPDGPVETWAHDLDPDKAQALFQTQRPEVQRMVLAYKMPAGGYRLPVALKPKKYDPTKTAVDQLQQALDLDQDHLASELKGQGKANWLGALTAGGVDPEQARLAAQALARRRPDDIIRGGVGAGPEGKVEPLLTMPDASPAQGATVGLVPFASDPLHQRLVKEGILEPGQYLSGYTSQAGRPAGQTGVSVQTPSLQLNAAFEPMAQRRLGFRDTGERLDQAINKQRSFAQEAVAQRELLREIAPQILTPTPKGKIEPENLRRVREVFDPAAGRNVLRHEVLTEVFVRPEEAEVLGVKEGRYLMPTALDEQFKVLMGRRRSGQEETVLADAHRALKDLTTFWVTNVLSAPGTWFTNLLSGGSQYSMKWWSDLAREGGLRRMKNDSLAPLLAMTPTYRRMIPSEAFGEGANLFRSLGADSGHFMKKTRQAMREGGQVSKTKKVLATGDAALAGSLKASLAPFSAVEDYWKRAVFISEARTMADEYADDLIKAGKAAPGQRSELRRSYLGNMLDEHPEDFTKVMLGPVDRYAYLYQNTPAWVDKLQDNAFVRMLWPFAKYPYKMGRMVGSHLNALNPYSAMPMRERAARTLGLVGSAALPYAGLSAYLGATGQQSQVDELQQRFREEHPGKDWPGTRTGGREFVGQAPDGPDGERRERYLRMVKYAPLNLWPLARGAWRMARYGDSADLKAASDEMKSVGPLAPLVGQVFELQPRYGARDVPGQAGEFLRGFIPHHRWLEWLAKQTDRTPSGGMAQRRPQGFQQEIQEIIPGQRQKLHQPVDRLTGRAQELDPLQEDLKFLTGVNLRDVETPREARAAAEYNLRQGQQWTKADLLAGDFTALYPEVDYNRLMDRKQEMLLAGQDELRRVEQGLRYQGFKNLQQALDKDFDPFNLVQQGSLKSLVGKASGMVAKGATGQRSLEQARQVIRLIGVNNWIVDHWPELKAE